MQQFSTVWGSGFVFARTHQTTVASDKNQD